MILDSIYIKKQKGLPQEFEDDILRLEIEEFAIRYKTAPTNGHELRKRYMDDLIFIGGAIQNTIVAYRIFRVINAGHLESMVMVVDKKYRGFGYSNLICKLSRDYFQEFGYKFISSWTHVDITAYKILEKFIPIISKKNMLSEIELKLLAEIEFADGKEHGYYGNMRRIHNYYEMVDETKVGDAFYWVHKI